MVQSLYLTDYHQISSQENQELAHIAIWRRRGEEEGEEGGGGKRREEEEELYIYIYIYTAISVQVVSNNGQMYNTSANE